MATMNVISITNPQPFMNKKYIIGELVKLKYLKNENDTSVKIGYTFKEQIPNKISLSFQNDDIANKFLNTYNGKYFNDFIEYKLDIKKESVTSIADVNLDEAELKKRIIKFAEDYANLDKLKYERKDKEQGLVLIDKKDIDDQNRTIAWLIKKIGSNILKGQSLMNISLPVFIFDKRTLLSTYAYELRLTPYFLSRAFYTKNYIDRLKWVTIYLLTKCHLEVLNRKPFNPTLGETYQCKIGNMNVYLEQTEHKPPTGNFYCFDDDHLYKVYGYLATTASLGTNSCKGYKIGSETVEFKDGSKYSIYYPTVYLRGTVLGKKTMNLKDIGMVVDEKNKIASYVKFNLGEKGFIKSFFSSPNVMPDSIDGGIYKVDDIVIDPKKNKHELKKKVKPLCNIKGLFLEKIEIDKEIMWEREDYFRFDLRAEGDILLSDSSHRMDMKLYIGGDNDGAQKAKEELEQEQRNFRKLREDNAKQTKK